MLADLINSASPGTISAVATALQQRTDGRRCVAAIERKSAKLGKQESKLSHDVREATDRLQREAVAALLEDREPVPPDPADVALIRKAGQSGAAITSAREQLSRDRDAALKQEADAEGAFAGATFALLSEMQARQQALVAEGLAGVAGTLSGLIAIDEAYAKFCGGRKLTISAGGQKAAPFSGETVIRNLVAALAVQFRSPAMELAELRRQAAPTAQQLIEFIEGDQI